MSKERQNKKKEEKMKEWENKIEEKDSEAVIENVQKFADVIKPILEGKSDEEIKKGIYFKVNDRKFMINAVGKIPEDIFDVMLWELDEEGGNTIHTEVRIDNSEDAKEENYEKFEVKAREKRNPDFYGSNFRKYHNSEYKPTEFAETKNATRGLACGLETMNTVANGEIKFE